MSSGKLALVIMVVLYTLVGIFGCHAARGQTVEIITAKTRPDLVDWYWANKKYQKFMKVYPLKKHEIPRTHYETT